MHATIVYCTCLCIWFVFVKRKKHEKCVYKRNGACHCTIMLFQVQCTVKFDDLLCILKMHTNLSSNSKLL